MKAARIILAVVLAAGAAAAEGGKAPTSPEAHCPAEAVEELRLLPEAVPPCEAEGARCQQLCEEGDGASCLGLAYAAEATDSGRGAVRALYRRACELGLANACTNWAASIWASEHTEGELECAARVFRNACVAREHFACGMLGRLGFARAESIADFEKAHRALERSCAELGGFPCRVLAKHLEEASPELHDRGEVRKLLERGCEGGDPDACGAPARASETFE